MSWLKSQVAKANRRISIRAWIFIASVSVNLIASPVYLFLIYVQSATIINQHRTIRTMMRNPACLVEPHPPTRAYEPRTMTTGARCELKTKGKSVPVECPIISDN